MATKNQVDCIEHGQKIVTLETKVEAIEKAIIDISSLAKEYDSRMDTIEITAAEAKGKGSVITTLLWTIITLLTGLGGTFFAYALGIFGGK